MIIGCRTVVCGRRRPGGVKCGFSAGNDAPRDTTTPLRPDRPPPPRAGHSQEAFADLAGPHRTYISLLERGRRTPSIEVVRKVAAALGTSMASLMRELEVYAD